MTPTQNPETDPGPDPDPDPDLEPNQASTVQELAYLRQRGRAMAERSLRAAAAEQAVVERMKKDLMDLQPVLQKAAKETAELLEEVARDQTAADEVKRRVTKEEEAVGIIATDARAIAADAQRDLDEAMPALAAAVKALESLDKKDTQEVKSFAKPPDLVHRVMEAICVLMGKTPSWDESKKLLNDSNFVQNLKDYDKDNIPEKIIKSLQRYMKMEDFDPDSVGRVSKACKSLCMWTRAIDTYARVAKTVEPKKAKLKAASDQLAESQATLKQKQDQLKEVEERVAVLKRKLDAAQTKAKELEEQEADTQVKLARAVKLVAAQAAGGAAAAFQDTGRIGAVPSRRSGGGGGDNSAAAAAAAAAAPTEEEMLHAAMSRQHARAEQLLVLDVLE